MPDFNDWYDGLTEAQQKQVQKNLTAKPPPAPDPEKEPEKAMTPMERMRAGYAAADDPSEVRKERRGL